jgi:DUF4097 and DUF4098 domain-containing protein YvlB
VDQTFGVGRAPTLKLDNFAGSISVRSGEDGEIRVLATKRAASSLDLERVRVEITERDDGLVIRTRKAKPLSNASVEFEITAPADTYLDLDTGAGNIQIEGFEAGAKVHTGSGKITVHGLGGGTDLHTGSGRISGTDLDGEIEADTGSGDVNLRNVDGGLKAHTGSGSIVIDGVKGDLDGHTGTGGIKVQNAGGWVELNTGSGSIEYQGEPEGDCRFETGSGGVTLRLPDSLDAEVDLHTGSGTVRVDYAVVGQVTKKDVKGLIGGGDGVRITADTGSGSIHLVRD